MKHWPYLVIHANNTYTWGNNTWPITQDCKHLSVQKHKSIIEKMNYRDHYMTAYEMLRYHGNNQRLDWALRASSTRQPRSTNKVIQLTK